MKSSTLRSDGRRSIVSSSNSVLLCSLAPESLEFAGPADSLSFVAVTLNSFATLERLSPFLVQHA